MCSIGDKLYIHIQADIQNTIPEKKEIEYSPALFDINPKHQVNTPNIYNNHTVQKDEKGVYFYPLVPLNVSTLNRLPIKERRKYFTERSLFQTLVRSSGKRKAKNLQDAVKKDYINHNIRTTLNGLFPPQSVVYIQTLPYTIIDYQWTPGDWKMEVKSGTPSTSHTHTPTKPKEPHPLLQSMPEHLLMGENYFEPKSKEPVIPTPCPFYYVIHIQLELFPGTKLPPELIKNLPCRHKWNSVRMAWTNITKRKRPRKRPNTTQAKKSKSKISM